MLKVKKFGQNTPRKGSSQKSFQQSTSSKFVLNQTFWFWAVVKIFLDVIQTSNYHGSMPYELWLPLTKALRFMVVRCVLKGWTIFCHTQGFFTVNEKLSLKWPLRRPPSRVVLNQTFWFWMTVKIFPDVIETSSCHGSILHGPLYPTPLNLWLLAS